MNGRDLPWLQETAQDDVWGAWSVTYRDVIILNSENVQVDAYNLSSNNLADVAKRDELKAKIRAARGSGTP